MFFGFLDITADDDQKIQYVQANENERIEIMRGAETRSPVLPDVSTVAFSECPIIHPRRYDLG